MAGREGSYAPKERINIRYRPATGGAREEQELPGCFLMIGDFSGKADDTALEDREIMPIRTKNDFAKVMKAQDLELEFEVKNLLSGEEGDLLTVKLRPESLEDFGPDRIAEQVPELNRLLELRRLLGQLKGPLGNVRRLRERLAEVLRDQAAVEQIVDYLRGRQANELLPPVLPPVLPADRNGVPAAPTEKKE